ncbi:pkd2 [Symbiodinium sp. CCMP2592]|nr:pkd2 [Symbiodinium sp. CCMP2592]
MSELRRMAMCKWLGLIMLSTWGLLSLDFMWATGHSREKVLARKQRRHVLYVVLFTAEQAKAQDEKALLLKRELPALPPAYARDAKQLADAIKSASITTIRVNRRGDAQAAKQLGRLEQDVAGKLGSYDREWLTMQLEFKKLSADDQAVLQEHPVFLSMKELIAKLQSGGSADVDITSFRLDLSRQAASILQLVEAAGVLK